ncbi:MAG: AbrB/MazE/SpoVT family DNA-binding domain-containing protein [Clostridiales bacterium]|nr:AbrB/MazE/SpoVT family DNA-binding domain-containing protein [Candidatus Equinaster intestinalis]
MKSLGMIRMIDRNGRIVIPAELRKQLDMKNDEDCFEIFTENDSIILKKYAPSCIFCGEKGEVITYGGHLVCLNCIEKLNNLKNTL